MTDLEMTRLCAEAMGLDWCHSMHPDRVLAQLDARAKFSHVYSPYAPLHDDAQAMALVRKFRLDISQTLVWDWLVRTQDIETEGFINRWHDARNTDLNRAICECVAKMQVAKCAS